MGFDAFKDKVKDVLGNEEQTDAGLDKAAEIATEKLGAEHADKIQQGRDMADGKVGDELQG